MGYINLWFAIWISFVVALIMFPRTNDEWLNLVVMSFPTFLQSCCVVINMAIIAVVVRVDTRLVFLYSSV